MTKKNFNDVSNPALQFMTQSEELTATDQKEISKEIGIKRGRPTSKEETKTKRLNLLMLPSVCEDIGKIAFMSRTSTNDLVNTVLQEYIDNHQELIKKYKEIFRE